MKSGQTSSTIEETSDGLGAQTHKRHGFATKVFYGLGSVAFGVKDNGFSVLLLLFYNQVLGLDARLTGLAIMLALIVDGLVDPLIGYASDNLRSRLGRRHPFMYAAAIPVSLSYLFLFSPPQGLSQQGLFAYLLVIAITVRVFIAIYEIPNSALIAELTTAYDERTSYLSYRFFFGWVGGLMMSFLAFSVFLRGTPGASAGQLQPEGYGDYGIAAASIMFVAILASSLGTQRAVSIRQDPAPCERATLGSILREIVTSLSNPSALTMLVSGMLAALALGLTMALVFYLQTFFWKLRPDQISTIILGNFVSAALALIGTPVAARHFDKRRFALGIAVALIVLTPVTYLLRLLGWFPENGSPVLLPVLFFFGVVSTTAGIAFSIMITSMLTDVVEDNEVRTGKRTEGVFFAANTFVAKCVSGLGVFLSAFIIGLVGFPDHAVPGQVPQQVLNQFAIVYVGAVTTLYVLSMLFVSRYRITRLIHQENLAVLRSKAAAAISTTEQPPAAAAQMGPPQAK